MRAWTIRGFIAIVASLTLAGLLRADGVGNNGAKTWRVAYHKLREHPRTKDHALRIRVEAPSGSSLTGTLKRYVFDNSTGTPIYKKRADADGGNIPLTGLILSAGGGSSSRKVEKFILSGYYTDADGPHEIVIRGYHTTGPTAVRDDDHVCVRIRKRDLTSGAGFAVAAATGAEPCDEQPPDEDVLDEVGPGGGGDDPYDGGP